MNHPIVKNIFFFVVLVLLQVLIFNNVVYWGYTNPMIYIIYLLAALYRENRVPYLLTAFLLGLYTSMFSSTGDLRATSSMLIAYWRSPILHLVPGKSFEYQELDLLACPFTKVFSYTILMMMSHHILFYFSEIFNFNHVLITLVKIICAPVFTTIVCLLYIYLFSKSRK